MGLFFTGDELVMPGEPLAPGRIYNSNRFTLRGLGELFGCELRDYGIVPDSLEATREVLRRAAAECDVIVTSGGVSVGDADYVKPAVEAEGKLLMWRIAMKPGRPLAFGKVGRSRFSSACPETRSRASSPSSSSCGRSCCAPRDSPPSSRAALPRAPISTGRSPTRGASSCA